MKAEKFFTKGKLALAGMVLLLGTAVWLNTRYSGNLKDNNTKYMGETAYVSSSGQNAVAVSAKAEEDYFSSLKEKRDLSYKESAESLEEIINKSSSTAEERKTASDTLALLTKRHTDETEIENILSVKGFKNVCVSIGDDSVSVAVKTESLTPAETEQIRDAVTGQTLIEVNKIKIITANG